MNQVSRPTWQSWVFTALWLLSAVWLICMLALGAFVGESGMLIGWSIPSGLLFLLTWAWLFRGCWRSRQCWRPLVLIGTGWLLLLVLALLDISGELATDGWYRRQALPQVIGHALAWSYVLGPVALILAMLYAIWRVPKSVAAQPAHEGDGGPGMISRMLKA